MKLNEFKLLSSSCWNERYQPLTFDMTKDKYTGRYSLGTDSLLVPHTIFLYLFLSIYPKLTKQNMIKLAKLAKKQKKARTDKNKNKISKQTHKEKIAESLKPLTKKLTEFNESTK